MSPRATEILARALGLTTDAVGPDTRLGTAPQWDSLAHMRIILAIEADLGRQLPAGDIIERRRSRGRGAPAQELTRPRASLVVADLAPRGNRHRGLR